MNNKKSYILYIIMLFIETESESLDFFMNPAETDRFSSLWRSSG